MAYNNRNRLERIVEVQEITLQWTKIGVKQERVYTDHIFPRWRISRRTFYYFLSINAKAELKKKEAAKQLSLF